MPADGEQVTVRALWPMPAIGDGEAVTVQWGPHLAALVDAGRYELLPQVAAPAAPGPASGGQGPGNGADIGEPGDAEAADERPGRRQRAR